jgi:hypothetical protein
MTHLVALREYTYAGYCSTGGNKDWVACLAIETDDQQSASPAIDETMEVVYLCLHGPHGGNMVVEVPKRLTMKQARTHFAKKCREKDGKAYKPVPFASYLPAFGRPFGLALREASGEGQSVDKEEASPENAPAGAAAPGLDYQVVSVKAAPLERIQQLLVGDRYGVSEKVNGEQCVLVFDGEMLTAYNRRGKLMSAPPAGAAHLSRLGCPFVIDGERLTGDAGGHFVAFDLLAWNREAMTSSSYVVRITTLEEAMLQANLLIAQRSTPTFVDARANSRETGLVLLVAGVGTDLARQVVEQIQGSSGEGIVIRRLESPYEESPLKFKFLADLDAFVIGVNDGVAEGSLKFGVIRSTDGATIEVANVRSGFVDADVRAVREMLKRGERPVFTVRYLPIRTIGIQLVEPRSGMAFLRSDKEAQECTTEQFGPEKASMIAQATSITGL